MWARSCIHDLMILKTLHYISEKKRNITDAAIPKTKCVQIFSMTYNTLNGN